MKRAFLIATVTSPPSGQDPVRRRASREVDGWELRADLAYDLPVSMMRETFDHLTIYSLRTPLLGGRFAGTDEQRRGRLAWAAKQFDLVELEEPRDVVGQSLALVAPENRILAGYAADASPKGLKRRFDELAQTPARYYRLFCRCDRWAEAAAPLLFLKSLGRKDVIVSAANLAAWTNLVAPSFGCPFVFGTAQRGDNGEGPSITRLIEDYGLPWIREHRELFGIVGKTTAHSLSPKIHNAAYRAVNRSALFVPWVVNDFRRFWQSIVLSDPLADVGLALRGLTVAAPHKQAAATMPGDRADVTRAAQSSNLVYCRRGEWRIGSSDPEGVLSNLSRLSLPLPGTAVAVIGCGGSGRAIAAAIKHAGARVVLFNRNPDHGRRAEELLGVPFVPLKQFCPDSFAVTVNATPVGGDGLSLPYDPTRLRDDGVVVDLVYGPGVTPLVEYSRSRGLPTIDGRDVLCVQAAVQFESMTGQAMPAGLAEELVYGNGVCARGDRIRSSSVQDEKCLPESHPMFGLMPD